MNGDSDMTLAFELEALKEVASPERVFEDARGWTEYIGVVSEKPTYVVTNFTRKNRIRQDFFSGPRGKAESSRASKTSSTPTATSTSVPTRRTSS